MAAVLKTAGARVPVGSNPSPTASSPMELYGKECRVVPTDVSALPASQRITMAITAEVAIGIYGAVSLIGKIVAC